MGIVEQLLDRFILATQQKFALECKIKELQKKLEPKKSVIKMKRRKLFLN